MGEMADYLLESYDWFADGPVMPSDFEPETPECPECGCEGVVVPAERVYGRSYGENQYVCACPWFPACDSYVGCHKGTMNPMGTMAGPELRKLRKIVHSAFDDMWKSGKMSRTAAYDRLSDLLGIPPERCHIAMFDAETCDRAIAELIF